MGWKSRSVVVAVVGVALSLAVACSDEAKPSSSEGEAGSAGEPTSPTAGGGQGGQPASPGCKEESDCKSGGDCSELAELIADCGNDQLLAYPTKCGGIYIERVSGATAASWLFDAQDKLIGGSQEDEGSCSYWGATCPTAGVGESLCNVPLHCVAHDECGVYGANFGCPPSLDRVEELCSLPGIQIERYASDCGGTYVDASNGIQHVIWSFDRGEKLSGFWSLGDVEDCDFWGEQCRPVGPAEALCDGAGGAGGAPTAGGAGGAPTDGGAGGQPAAPQGGYGGAP